MQVPLPLLGDTSLWKILFTGVFIFLVSRVQKFISGLHAVNNMHGLRVPLDPLTYGNLFPNTWWNTNLQFIWLWRHRLYRRFPNHSDTFSVVPFIFGGPGIYSANLDVCRQVAGGPKCDFVKTKSFLGKWGTNVLTAENELWKKHRRIMGPAFNNDLYERVWMETVNTYHEMISVENWGDKDVVNVPAVQKLTFKLALLIIGKCGFGFPFNWSSPPKDPDGKLSFQESLRIIMDATILIALMPPWILRLPFARFKQVRTADAEMMKFMQGQVAVKRREYANRGGREGVEGDKGNDVFTLLVNANEEEEMKFKLDDQELVGNVFILLFAGHETTAHTLAATLALLALHQEIQQEILEQILTVVGSDREPTFDDYSKLDKVLAAFYESLRLFPTAYILVREATKDTVLDVPNPRGKEGSTGIPIQKGMKVMVDMIGIQHNPRYFDEPEKFKPSRWYGESNESEIFTAFSVGPRSCIGRKFTTTEAVCFLTLLLREWKVEPLLEEGETQDAWRDRVFRVTIGITLGITGVPVRLVRRSSC